jgi:sn-glycerol 3-phosphate transport system permease protein
MNNNATKTSTKITQSRLAGSTWYIHLLLWVVVIFMMFPVLYAMLTSTQSNAEMFRLQMTPGDHFGINLKAVLDRDIVLLLFNTFVVAGMITVGKVVLSLFGGMALVYFRFPGKNLVFILILSALMIPGEVTIIALYRLVVMDLGWGNTWTAIVVPALATPTGLFLFRQHFAGITPELCEAAQLDGATPLQFLFRILLPISKATVAALVTIMFISGWNNYLWPSLVITDPKKQVIQVGLSSLDAGLEVGATYGPIMLGAVIASIVPILVFVLMQKQFMQGFAITRDK